MPALTRNTEFPGAKEKNEGWFGEGWGGGGPRGTSSTQPLFPQLDDTFLGQFRHQPDKDQLQGAVH